MEDVQNGRHGKTGYQLIRYATFYHYLVPTRTANPGRNTQCKHQVLQYLFWHWLSTSTACSSRVPIASSHKTKSHLKQLSIA